MQPVEDPLETIYVEERVSLDLISEPEKASVVTSASPYRASSSCQRLYSSTGFSLMVTMPLDLFCLQGHRGLPDPLPP